MCFGLITSFRNYRITKFSSSGYKFRDAEAISPFLELPQKGVTSRFCQDLARRLRSCVIAGYPEKKVNGIPGTSDDDSSSVGYNSAVIFGKDGTFMNNYRKVNMFEMDKTWAQPGELRTVLSLALYR